MKNNIEEICLNESDNDIIIDKLKASTMKYDDAYNLSEFFKVYGDITRIRIIHLLAKQEVCVHEIAASLDMSQSAISHQLKMLRQFKLVKPRKVGKHVFYSLADDHVIEILNNGLEHIHEQ